MPGPVTVFSTIFVLVFVKQALTVASTCFSRSLVVQFNYDSKFYFCLYEHYGYFCFISSETNLHHNEKESVHQLQFVLMS